MKVLILEGYWKIKCRACKEHLIPQFGEHKWNFNGNVDRPTFTPSVKETCNDPSHPSYQPRAKSSVCHYIITDGKIQYCADCTHNLAGQTMELEDFTENEIAARS